MPLEMNPGTAEVSQVVFSNDAATKLEVVSPSNPMPVTATISSIATITNPVGIKGADGSTIASGSNPLPVSTVGVTSTTLTATQVTVPATTNGILLLAANSSRKGATISNPGTVSVYIQQGSTGVTITNGFGIPGGSSYNIDEPLYTGAIYGIVATGTQVVTVVELT